jgi:hypothetical protein
VVKSGICRPIHSLTRGPRRTQRAASFAQRAEGERRPSDGPSEAWAPAKGCG